MLENLYAKEIEEIGSNYSGFSAEELKDNEDFWSWVQQSYTVSPNIINLNNGGVSPQPKVVQDCFEKYNRLCNEAPSYYMWNILDQGREALRYDLAKLAGCSVDEIVINRNTTEALDTIIFGLDLKAGDEVILTKHDYPNVINAWKQREKREGIKIKYVELDFPIENEDEIVKKFSELITSHTKIINVTHIINVTGQIMPVKKIAQMAHKKGIDVMCDAAHSFALLDYKIPDIECDYFGTSLHKWLCAPLGTGLLYVKKDKIQNIWPLFPDEKPLSDNMLKFEKRLGTRSFPTELAIGSAIDFHLAIGSKRKEERIRYLKNYWMNGIKDLPKVKIHTSFKPEFACAIGVFSIEHLQPADVVNYLFDNYKIHVVGIDHENICGVRVSPHVYTNLRDLDRLIDAITQLVKK
jgi:selenocysteine lyase/cysteine desulfurase